MPNLGQVSQVPILGTSPKLNPKLDLKSSHILKALTTMQNFYTYGDQNAPLKPICNENAPLKLMHLELNSMPTKGM
jgi:hypothetical protein